MGDPHGPPVARPPIASIESGLQGAFARALRDLVRHTRCTRSAVWAHDEAGRPRVLAARLPGARIEAPNPEVLDAACALEGPVDLGTPAAGPVLGTIPASHGLHAAAPIAPGPDGATAVILMGHDAEPPGRVRPRNLAVLGKTASLLSSDARTASAARRLLRLDDHVRRLDRLAALGGLVAEIVHEIRNPLVSVKTFLQLLPERIDDPEFRESFLSVASDELRRVERLLDVVLEHGRPAPAAREDDAAEVGAALEGAARLVAHRAADQGVAVEVAAVEGNLVVPLAADGLRQVVLNLLLNALDATPSGGSIRLGASATDDAIEIRVDDDGPGIPETLAEHLFEPFVTTREGAPGGLGLAITRRIVEEAGGRVGATPRAEGGTRFAVALPRGR